MTKQVQRRRGTASQHTSFTGAEGEISVNTTNKSVHVHDGVTAGGVEAARADLANVSDASLNTALAGNTLSSLTITSADINGGTIDGTVIGGTTPAAVTATSLTATGTTTLAGASTTADITFGDNDKAIFGAGSDLQIYHDGFNSYIREQGTGDLFIQGGANIIFEKTGGEDMLTMTNDGSVVVKYNGVDRIETTSAGTTMTGTVTADGLTVDGDGILQTSDGALLSVRNSNTSVTAGTIIGEVRFESDDASRTEVIRNSIVSESVGSAANANLHFRTAEGDTLSDRMTVSYNGDISFYEDTGTTPKMVWKAADERLGLGTASPSATLHIDNGSSTHVYLRGSSGDPYGLWVDPTGAEFTLGSWGNGARIKLSDSSEYITFGTGVSSTERMRIDSSGNLLVGKSSLNTNTVGHEIKADGRMSATSNGNIAFFANRQTSDGEIVRFAKDGTTVGSIASTFGTDIHIGSGDTRLRFVDDNDYIRAASSDGGSRDGLTSLGAASHRFKDLYLSGNISMGGRILDNTHIFANSANTTEYARFDASGNLLVGRTDTSSATAGTVIYGGSLRGVITQTYAGRPHYINRLTSDGDIIEFAKDGAPVGSIGSASSGSVFDISGGTNEVRITGGNVSYWVSAASFYPGTDNARDLGAASFRWDDVYATNGTIQTSDRNEKQDIAELDEAERRVAVAAKGLLRKFRWKDAVAEKGDDARIHFGIIAQDLQAAFEAEGLDAGKYAMFIHTTWTDEETGEERSRMGVRYSELLAFIIAAI